MSTASSPSFLARHEFLLRRLHSLSGLIPVGAYMCVHLLTNSTVLDSPATFQKAVYGIHGLGAALPVIEWGFIFIPILFHAIFGVIIIRGGLPNSGTYKYSSNIRYTLQRATGMIAFFFIVWHVFHMHGWLHTESWEKMAHSVGGAQFKPYSAASTAASALQGSFIVPILYTIGILSCVFHLANGIWTFGITWGIWVTPAAQQRATIASVVFGVALAAVGMSALGGFSTLKDLDKVREEEYKMYTSKEQAGEKLDEHKRGEDLVKRTSGDLPHVNGGVTAAEHPEVDMPAAEPSQEAEAAPAEAKSGE